MSAPGGDSRPIAVLVDREGLGDVMLKVPFLRALRRAWPDRDVWWIATHQSSMGNELRPLFERDVAKVITGAALNGPIGGVWRRLRALPPFEKVFDARTKISVVALARHGLTHRGFYCCLPGYIFCDGAPRAGRRRPRGVSQRMLSLIACATGKPADGSGWLTASPAARAAAAAFLPEGRTYVCIAPGSRETVKNWPSERFYAVARDLVARGVTPVFRIGPVEHQSRAEIEAAVPGALISQSDYSEGAPPGQALDQLIGQSGRFAAALANDNGVGHLLGGAGVPVVSLFGPTDPKRWAPVAPVNLILRAQDFGGAEMSAIPTEPVVAAVMEMLSRRPG